PGSAIYPCSGSYSGRETSTRARRNCWYWSHPTSSILCIQQLLPPPTLIFPSPFSISRSLTSPCRDTTKLNQCLPRLRAQNEFNDFEQPTSGIVIARQYSAG